MRLLDASERSINLTACDKRADPRTLSIDACTDGGAPATVVVVEHCRDVLGRGWRTGSSVRSGHARPLDCSSSTNWSERLWWSMFDRHVCDIFFRCLLENWCDGGPLPPFSWKKIIIDDGSSSEWNNKNIHHNIQVPIMASIFTPESRGGFKV